MYVDSRPGNGHVKLKGPTSKYALNEHQKTDEILPAILLAIAAVLGGTAALTNEASVALKRAYETGQKKS